ncbi:FMN-binding negative transcriptional regulator [Microbacterium indicum]|uniref:FMN-binding negative transcriptional regulator n=1 Tax=Microbacterium indicum TaxID=358100 RepID=UPI0003FBF269|nr:FMN-binding negative transcriptional regulator [Microbacterium indicum]
MWVNPLFSADARSALRVLATAETLATLVVEAPLRAAHLPLLFEERDDDRMVLIGHIPRVDPLAAAITTGQRVLCVFHGPRAYVSGGWYGDTPGLSTYNFSVAHVSGPAEPMRDRAELRSHLVDLIDFHERRKQPADGGPWALDARAQGRIDELLPAVIGFRILVDEAQAKQKIGQNRTPEDRASTIAHLERSPQEEHRDIARAMRDAEDGSAPRRAGH